MDSAYLDLRTLSGIHAALTDLLGLPFSLYSGSGAPLAPAAAQDPLPAHITAAPEGAEEYRRFLLKGIEKVSLRNDTALLKGPAQQNFLFIPLALGEEFFALVSAPFYLKAVDFERFVLTEGARYGISPEEMEKWSRRIVVKDYAALQKNAGAVRLIIEAVLRSGYERTLNQKQYHWMKTLTYVALNMGGQAEPQEGYRLVLDALLFLFDIESASILIKEGSSFRTVAAAGRRAGALEGLVVENAARLSQAVEKQSVFFTADAAEIAELGFPPETATLHVIPRLDLGDGVGVVAVGNAALTKEQSQTIIEFLKLAGLSLRNLSLQSSYRRCLADLGLLSTVSSQLLPHLHDRAKLHEAIVNAAAEITRAEQGSLMVPEEGALTVAAAKGATRWLMQGMTVGRGEGIAGRAFEEGRPLTSRDRVPTERAGGGRRHHYKTGAFVSMPLLFENERLAVLNLADKETAEEFSELDLGVLGHFASYAALALKVAGYRDVAAQMKELSITDPVTGLYNRRYLEERFTEELHRSGRYGLAFSLALLDVDDFKLFNDTEGHLAGDKVLRDVARIFHRNSRVNDVVCRFGGEEFAVLMPQTAKTEAFLVAERIRNNIRDTLSEGWGKYPHRAVTVSMGIASFPEDGETTTELLKNADTALYRAKALGKDRTMLYKKV